MTRVTLSLVLLVAAGCDPPPPAGPLPVRPGDLARAYAEDPALAARAYDGQAVLVPLAACRQTPGGWEWALGGGPDSPAVVVLSTAGPPPALGPGAWVAGVCAGRREDAVVRERAAYRFTVTVTNCRPCPPPR